jgi:redox-regulated HSP33 family molecular chaperone
MNKAISVLAILMILAVSTVMAAAPQKSTHTEKYDINGDGILDTVVVEQSQKMTKKSTVVEKSYFSEAYMIYLGQELIVDGVLMIDTFQYNN